MSQHSQLTRVFVLSGALLPLLIGAGAQAALYRANCSGPTVLTLPCRQTLSPRAYLRGADGKWRPAQYTQAQGRLIFKLDPAALGGPTAMILIDPPPSLVMNDNQPPLLLGVKVDGRPVSTKSPVDLGQGKNAPHHLLVAFADTQNALDLSALTVAVDHEPLPAGSVQKTSQGRRMAHVAITLPELDYGKHEIVVTARDASPQANAATLTLRFRRIDTTDLALAALGARVKVDSCFPGYESLAALNDGVTTMPGDHCGNDISWASAEVDADHWAEVILPRPRKLKEVTVYWAAYTGVYHTPRHFEVQVPQGTGWRAVYQSPAAGEKPKALTTAHFARPVTTDRFRVFMPAGQGSATRPNLLWIGEIQAR